MKHCVNCDFHLPQHYVAACPYCGQDPNTLGSAPKKFNKSSDSHYSLEPTSETLLSFGRKQPAMSGVSDGQFIRPTNSAHSGVIRRSSPSASRAKPSSKHKGNDRLMSKVVAIIVLATLSALAFEYRHILASMF